MVRDEPLPSVDPEPGVRIERVESMGDAERFLDVLAGAYGVDGVGRDLAARIFFDASCLLEPEVVGVLAYLDGEPVGTTMALLHEGTIGLYWTSALPHARRRGVGRASFVAVVNEGFRRGGDLATLQASGMGEPIWRALGFREVRRYRRYLGSPVHA
jgi:GNAT superfamily N-acetyltransferase